ncbi:putative ribonuclease H-like domain-containing protein [Tanacetum coccineum]
MDKTRPRTSNLSRTPHRPQRPKKIVKSIWVKKGSTVATHAVLPQTVKEGVMMKSNQTWRPKGAYLDSVNRDNGSYTLKQFEYGNPEEDLKDYAIIDSGCSGSMTGDKDKLSDFKEFKGGYVAFGNDSKGGRISGKGTIKTSCLDFEKVSYVEELKFNLLSVSQICDKKHNVLFTDKECLILSPKFKFVDEDLARKDEAVLWHRRLGHVNFKNINKLVKGNLVRGLPSKTFKLEHSCLACRKGKQHRASCKKIEERTVREPLELLHMDLFGPVSVESVNRKKYCLVVTDDCSKFSWVFFLAYKDETYDMLHDLIVGLENKLRHKVKTIRCDHGTEFKNQLMNEFCAKKGIKREYSIARTPQQNGVAERKNRTLIEAARTMLADSLLPIQFWAEAVNTACYVLNRVLVTKPQMKTPYEILMGRSPNISFMRPFGCPLTILNTLDHLGKFDGKSEEGYLLGYSTNSKGFRVYNRVTRKVQDCLHVNFLENQENQKGKGPDWMFDLELLTPSMNYIPVRKENYADSGGNVSTHDDVDDLDDQQFIVHGPNISSTEAEYVAAASCCAQRLINVVKVHTDDNVADLLTKGFDLARFNFLVVTIESLEALLVVIDKFELNSFFVKELATSQLKVLLVLRTWLLTAFPKQVNLGPRSETLAMSGHIANGKPFLMYPRFIQLFLDKQLEGVTRPQNFLPSVTLPSKVFTFMRKHSPKFSCRITPLTPPMLEVITALAAEEAHSESTHSRAASSPRDAQGTPTQSAALQGTAHTQGTEGTAETQGTAESQGTAETQGNAEAQGAAAIPQSPNDYTPTDASQTSGGDEGLLDLYALNREVRRLKKQTISQAKQIHKLKAKLKKLSKGVKPLVKHHILWVKSQKLKKRGTKKKKKVSSVKLGRNKDEGNLSEENNDQDDHTAFVYKDEDVFVAVTPDLERKSDETEQVTIEEEKDASDVKSGDTEELDLEEIQSTARQSAVTPRTLNFEDEAGSISSISGLYEDYKKHIPNQLVRIDYFWVILTTIFWETSATSDDDVLEESRRLGNYKMKKASIREQIDQGGYIMDLSCYNKATDRVHLTDTFDIFLGRPGPFRCRFSWCKDVSVDRRFWEIFVCLDPRKKGCDNEIARRYVDGTSYKVTWSDVDQVFMPINEIDQHWCLAQLHIQTGVVTFYDSGEGRLLCAWLLEVDGHSVTSYMMIVSVSTPYSSKLLGFNNDEQPIIEVDDIATRLDYHSPSVQPRHLEIFRTWVCEVNSGVVFVWLLKELLIWLIHSDRRSRFAMP